MLQTVNFTGKLPDKEKTKEATSCLSYFMTMTCQDPSSLVKQALKVTCPAKKIYFLSWTTGQGSFSSPALVKWEAC